MASLDRILIIEDEPKVAEALRQGLQEAGYSAATAGTGEEGLVMVMEHTPDAVVLDLNLPQRDGMDILHTLRRHHPRLPVLILSARDTVEDRVTGLDAGADDYLVKPFAFAELLARLRVMLRREPQLPPMHYDLFDLQVDIVARKVERDGRDLKLTPREFAILELLLRNTGKPVSRQTIAKEVWQVQRATPIDNVIDVHMMRLRKKIDREHPEKLIQTVRGLGFMIEPNP